jgi:P4 family phage/plasmid primase-like protien
LFVADVVGLAPFAPGNIAAAWWLAGCSVVPIGTNKRPFVDWKDFQTTRAHAGQVRTWFEQTYPTAGVAVICGSVSGGVEMLELEGRANNPDSITKIEAALREAGILDIWEQLHLHGYSERTPHGGLHLLYRIPDNPVPGNTKIAERWATPDEYTEHEQQLVAANPERKFRRVLSETRGEGGYVVVAPSSGACHPSGRPWETLSGTPQSMLELSWVEREQLHTCIRQALNEIWAEVAIPGPAPERPPRAPMEDGALSPGDDFNLRASWEEPWFMQHGWTIHHRNGDEVFWTRPGKDPSEGHSASTGYVDGVDRLYIWSSSTELPSEQPITKFYAHSLLNFNGQLRQCAKALRLQGFGTPVIQAPALGDFDLELGGQPAAANGGVAEPPRRHDLHSPEHLRPGGGLIYTDTGYARRLYDRYKDTFRYHPLEKRWYIWEPGSSAWTPTDGSMVTIAAESLAEEALLTLDREMQRGAGGDERRSKLIETLYKQALTAMSNSRIASLVGRFRDQAGITVDPDVFDNNTDLLNLMNCTYNLANNTVTSHRSADMLTMTFGASYDPDARCPRFLKFIEETMPDPEVRAYVQRALGYSLTGRPTKRVMFMLHGPSGTGKSVLTSVMTELFGGYGATAPATTFRMKKNDTTVDIHHLRGKRFVATSEMPEGALLDEELIKRVTGGDVITSRTLFESFQSWRAHCVIWIATNFLPRLSSDDNAIWRRAKTIPMRTEFTPDGMHKEIEGLADQLLHERDGILNWLLDGLTEYRRIGLGEPAAISQDISTYRTEMDSVSSWFQAAIRDGEMVLDAGANSSTQLLYQRYSAHCNDDGVQPLGRRRFTKRLSTMVPGDGSRKLGGQMMWQGLSLNGGLD